MGKGIDFVFVALKYSYSMGSGICTHTYSSQVLGKRRYSPMALEMLSLPVDDIFIFL